MKTITLFSFTVPLEASAVNGRNVDPQTLAAQQAKKYLDTPKGKWVTENNVSIKLYAETSPHYYSCYCTIRGTLTDQQVTDFYLRFGTD